MIAKRWFRTSTIGVEIGKRFVQIVRIDRGATDNVTAAIRYRRSHEGAVDEAAVIELRHVLERQGLSREPIVLATPRTHVMSNVLEIPATTGNIQPHQLARMEMARIHQIPPGSFELACWQVPRQSANQKMDTLMVHACPHSSADALLNLFEKQGLDIIALDLHTCALVRACAARLGGELSLSFIAQLGWSGCHLLAIRGTRLAYERFVPEINLTDYCERLKRALDDDQEAAEHVMSNFDVDAPGSEGPVRPEITSARHDYLHRLASEVKACAQYMRQQHTDVREVTLFLAGDGAELSGISRQLHTELDMNIESASPASPATTLIRPRSETDISRRTGLTVALGLALYGEGG